MIETKLNFSLVEAGERLGVSRSTVVKLANSGELFTVKIRDRRLVPSTAILDYQERLVQGQAHKVT